MSEQIKMDFIEPRDIFLSIRPNFANLIARREKMYEFRRYKPKDPVKKLWLYVTSHVSELKYIAEVGDVVEYPTQIPEDGIGNSDFNKGLNVSKFGFPIIQLDKLVKGIPISELRSRFNFNSPQGFIYTDTFPELVDYVKSCEMRRLY
jgi:predicted transcriptional regulator